MTTPQPIYKLSIEVYKKQAKALLASFRNKDPQAIHRVLILHPDYHDIPIDRIIWARFQLADAQLIIAREYGFPSWARFKQEIEKQIEAKNDISITIEQDKRSLNLIVEDFHKQLGSNEKIDRTILRNGMALINKRLDNGWPVDKKTIDAGRFVCQWMKDGDTYIKLLQRYLESDLSVDGHLWAKCEVIIQLAILGRSSTSHNLEATKLFRELVPWMISNLPKDKICTQMAWNTTIAKCFLKFEGGGDEWLSMLEKAQQMVIPTVENRMDRFNIINTKSIIQGYLERYEDALNTLGSSGGDIIIEDTDWPQRYYTALRLMENTIEYQRKLGNNHMVNDITKRSLHVLADYRRYIETDKNADRNLFNASVANLGIALYRDRQYSKAIPLIREAASPLEQCYQAYTLTVLAASIWAETGDKIETLHIIKRAAEVSTANNYIDLSMFDEFKSVLNDQDFVEASAVYL